MKTSILALGLFLCGATMGLGTRVSWATPTLHLGRKTMPLAMAISPGGRTLAVVTEKEVPVRFKESGGLTNGFRFESSLQLWNLSTRKRLGVLLSPIDAPRSAAFSPDGRLLAAGTGSGDVVLWNVKTRKRLWTLSDVGGPDTVSSVAFAPNGKSIVTGWASEVSENWGRLVFWNLNTRNPARMTGTQQRVSGGACNIQSVAYSPDGQTVVSGSWGYSRESSGGASVPHRFYGELRFVNARTGQLLRLIKTKSEGIGQVVFSPNRNWLATTAITRDTNSLVRVRNAKTGALLHTRKLAHFGTATATFLADGSTLAIGEPNGTVVVWNPTTNSVTKRFRAHASGLSALVFNPRTHTLLTASPKGEVKRWHLKP